MKSSVTDNITELESLVSVGPRVFFQAADVAEAGESPSSFIYKIISIQQFVYTVYMTVFESRINTTFIIME